MKPLLTLTCLLAACAGAPADRDAGTGDRVGWRVLVDEHDVGADPGVHVAVTAAEYDAVWRQLGFDGGQPNVDTSEEVVVAFTVPYPVGCEFPFISVEVDHAAHTIAPRYGGNEPAVCGDDLLPYTVAVAISRSDLIADLYDLRLTAVSSELAEATRASLRLAD